MSRPHLSRSLTAALILVVTVAILQGTGSLATQQNATPTAYSCEAATPSTGLSTPEAEMDHGGMEMGTPAAMVEFDQMYIDMMIPHHASIMAMAEAALPRLQDERLRVIAEAIIAAQGPEIVELRGYREQFYGSAEPAPMGDEMMAMMDAEKQVAAFCAAADSDLAFIDLTIPHHLSAIVASEAALQQAVHPEIRDFAQRVIDAQQREIDELTAIRQEIYGSATPEGSPHAMSHDGSVVDQASLIEALRALGLNATVIGPLQQPFLQPQSGAILHVSDGTISTPAEIQVYEYADAGAAKADLERIGPDGQPDTAIIEWVAPPHFFQAGRLVVLYVGSDPTVIDTLTQVLGVPLVG
jgi:uncharacterized protein (DUF305 family)